MSIRWKPRRLVVAVIACGAVLLGIGLTGITYLRSGDIEPWGFLFMVSLAAVSISQLRWMRLVVDEEGVAISDEVSYFARRVEWKQIEAIDRKHLTYTLARDFASDTGIQLSWDAHMRSRKSRHRRIPLWYFVDDERWDDLRGHVRRHRPDLMSQ